MSINNERFVLLKNAIAPIHDTVNLVGVVSETGLPRTTRGTDVFCPVKIIDRTRLSIGLYVHFFAETMDLLPMVHTIGDIMVVYKVKIKTHGKGVNAVYHKTDSSFAIFRRREDGNSEVVPYQCSSNYAAREQDKDSVVELRNWMGDLEIGGLYDLLSLSEIKVRGSANLLCKILHVCEVKEKVWMLFVWDGTDIPPLPVEANLEDEKDNPLPLQLEPSLLPRDMLCSFPIVGSVLRIIIDLRGIEIGATFIQTKRWVKLVNINFESRDALWHAVFLPQSKLCYLPDDTDLVLERIRSFEMRKKLRRGHMPLTSLPRPSHVAETDSKVPPPVTLMTVLTYPEVTYRFKCVVRVVAIFPWKAEEFRHATTGIYRVRLTLEDPTARIHAYIYGEDGVKFFGNDHSVDILTRKRDMLLGISGGDGGQTSNQVSRNTPWIQCCLKSYYIDKADIWGSRNYRIFGTTLS